MLEAKAKPAVGSWLWDRNAAAVCAQTTPNLHKHQPRCVSSLRKKWWCVIWVKSLFVNPGTLECGIFHQISQGRWRTLKFWILVGTGGGENPANPPACAPLTGLTTDKSWFWLFGVWEREVTQGKWHLVERAEILNSSASSEWQRLDSFWGGLGIFFCF